MNTEHKENNPSQGEQIPLGMRLRRAREEQGLSMQNVADSLCLRVSVVRDLEEKTVNERQIEAFTRGYIRAYAKKVGLNGEALLLEYTGKSNDLPLKLQSFSKKTRHRKQDHRVMTLTWAILTVAIGVTIAWWWQSPSDEVSVLSQQKAAPAGNKLLDNGLTFVNPALANDSGNAAPVTNVVKVNDSAASRPASSQPSIPVQHAGASNDVAAQPAEQVKIEAVQPVTAPAQTVALENTAPTSMLSQPVVPAQPKPAEAALVQTSAPAEPVRRPTQAVVKQHAAPQSKSLFTMSFVADCWVDIVDAKGKKLLTGIKSRGDVVELNGQPPIKVVLGAPAAVKLTYKGKLVDLSQYPPKRVARLSLPMSE
ncbi:MAG: cytoskeleton protein RodZ [Vibrionaceae bacterium]